MVWGFVAFGFGGLLCNVKAVYSAAGMIAKRWGIAPLNLFKRIFVQLSYSNEETVWAVS